MTIKNPYRLSSAQSIQNLENKLMRSGKGSVAQKLLRKTAFNMCTISRKSNPHTEFIRTIKSSVFIKFSTPSSKKKGRFFQKKDNSTLDKIINRSYKQLSIYNNSKGKSSEHTTDILHLKLLTTIDSSKNRANKRSTNY